MDDGTSFRDYQGYMKVIDRRRMRKKFAVRFIVIMILILSGMGIQFFIDRDNLKIAEDCLKREICQLESMPEPTAEQKAQAKRNVKRVTTEYLNKREVVKK